MAWIEGRHFTKWATHVPQDRSSFESHSFPIPDPLLCSYTSLCCPSPTSVSFLALQPGSLHGLFSLTPFRVSWCFRKIGVSLFFKAFNWLRWKISTLSISLLSHHNGSEHFRSSPLSGFRKYLNIPLTDYRRLGQTRWFFSAPSGSIILWKQTCNIIFYIKQYFVYIKNVSCSYS